MVHEQNLARPGHLPYLPPPWNDVVDGLASEGGTESL